MKNKKDSLESLPNIGKIIAGKLQKIDITTADEFLARDPYEIFEELLEKVDPTLCRCALASIVGAKQGVKWHKITREANIEFLKRYPKHKWGKC